MKRFYTEVTVASHGEGGGGGWRVLLDGRPIRTQGGQPQVVPTRALAEALAEEWRAQGEEIDPKSFVLRDLADLALDRIGSDRADTIAGLLRFAETDTLCYRADPEDALFRHQESLWEPLVTACEARHGVHFARVSGIVHRPVAPEHLARLRGVLDRQDDFALAALLTLASLGASLVVALAALEDGADPAALFTAANCEEDWQARQWGWDDSAKQRRDLRETAFLEAYRFLELSRSEP